MSLVIVPAAAKSTIQAPNKSTLVSSLCWWGARTTATPGPSTLAGSSQLHTLARRGGVSKSGPSSQKPSQGTRATTLAREPGCPGFSPHHCPPQPSPGKGIGDYTGCTGTVLRETTMGEGFPLSLAQGGSGILTSRLTPPGLQASSALTQAV